MAGHPKIELTGTTQGMLTYIKDAPTLKVGNKYHRMILVHCACGTERTMKAGVYLAGKAISCGCFLKKRRSEVSYHRGLNKGQPEVTPLPAGYRRGRLTTLAVVVDTEPEHKPGYIKYWCRCDCGTVLARYKMDLVQTKNPDRVLSCGCYTKEFLKLQNDAKRAESIRINGFAARRRAHRLGTHKEPA